MWQMKSLATSGPEFQTVLISIHFPAPTTTHNARLTPGQLRFEFNEEITHQPSPLHSIIWTHAAVELSVGESSTKNKKVSYR